MDCVRFGAGSRTMVLIPGLRLRPIREMAYAMGRMYRRFAAEYTVYILDRLDPAPAGYTVRAMAADTAEAMDSLGLAGADVLGVSQGGMIALDLALDRPELVGKLALAVTAARPNDALRQAVGRWEALAKAGDYDGLVADVMERMYSEEYLRRFGRLLPLVSRAGDRVDRERFAVLTRACLTCGAYDRLEGLRCPVLVLGGRRDKVLTGAASEEIAAKLGCEIYMYDELGHSAYEEARDFNDRVAAFFDEK